MGAAGDPFVARVSSSNPMPALNGNLRSPSSVSVANQRNFVVPRLFVAIVHSRRVSLDERLCDGPLQSS